MRRIFGEIIAELAEKDPSVYLLVSDIGVDIFDKFRKNFPSRFLNLGICEQSIIGIAAGMALEGLKPYVHTITPFLIERPFEQVKLDIDQQNVNVKLVGYADYPKQGPTHTELDAPKLMSLFKNINSYFPKDSEETKKALIESYGSNKPSFISLKKDKNYKAREKVLVTGGAGYVGSVLVRKLLDKGYDVRVLDIMLFGDRGLNEIKDKIEIIQGDVRDYELVDKCLEGVKYVIHLAAIANDPCGNLNPQLTQDINFEATKNLVKKAKEKGVKRFVFSSSSSVYGIKEEPNVTENMVLEPLTIYSKTKAEAEKAIIAESSSEFYPVCIRSATVCGFSPRQRLDVIVNILASRAIEKGEVIVNGGDQFRPNIHIEDITDLYVSLLSVPADKIAGQIFNYGAKNHTVSELAEVTKEVIGEHVKIIEKPSTPDSRSYRISSDKIKNVLGIEPKRTIKQAIVDLKKAFDSGLISNTSDTVYRNVEKMKEIGFK